MNHSPRHYLNSVHTRMVRFAYRITFLILAGMFSGQLATAEPVLIEGLEWRQLTDTAGAGLTWNDVASVCPLDETPCQGSVKGVDFTGWIWASPERVYHLVDVLTGLTVPSAVIFDSPPVPLFFDNFDAVMVRDSVQLSYGFMAGNPDAGTIDILKIQDSRSPAGQDRIELDNISVTDTLSSPTFFPPQPIGVFLVRDPDLELCGNGIDDDGDGDIDAFDDDCVAANPLVNGFEWRQPADTTGFSFRDVFSVCPNRGEPCEGSLGSTDFSNWIWASYAEVQALLETVTGRTIKTELPYNDNFTAPYFSLFTPTFQSSQVRDVYAFANDGYGELMIAENSEDPATCFNGIDDDGDGRIDGDDADCGNATWLLVRDSFDPGIKDSLRTLVNSSTHASNLIGFYLYRDPVFVTAEVCDNTFDDDGDGLIDEADLEDCQAGLKVKCTHDPMYIAQSGEVVTIRAEAVNEDAQPVMAEELEIRLGFDKSTPQAFAELATEVTLEYPPGGDFSYACAARRGSERATTGWRTVNVGDFEPSFPAIPLILNGSLGEKIDIVFFRDEDEYASVDDPDFIDDVSVLIKGGFYTVPWILENQEVFNFWLGRDTANSGPDPDDDDPSDGIRCLREGPDNLGTDYTFADSAAIVHRSICRDNANLGGLFTIEVDFNRLQVVAHEAGHTPFGLADEYCCDGGYFTRESTPPYPNMFEEETACRDAANDRGYDPNGCRSVIDVDSDEDWWLFEPDYDDIDPEPLDLMQQQGCDSLTSRAACQLIEPTLTGSENDPNGTVACAFSLETYRSDPDGVSASGDETYWICRRSGDADGAIWVPLGETPFFDRYDAGDSEEDRMNWMVDECEAGRC